jgi:hypothetical protein
VRAGARATAALDTGAVTIGFATIMAIAGRAVVDMPVNMQTADVALHLRNKGRRDREAHLL